jgi:hypothetical protein
VLSRFEPGRVLPVLTEAGEDFAGDLLNRMRGKPRPPVQPIQPDRTLAQRITRSLPALGDSMATAPHYLRQFFVFEHLRGDLQEISRRFADLAAELDQTLPDNPEKTTALRKLLEAKDCAVRARLFKADGP